MVEVEVKVKVEVKVDGCEKTNVIKH